jgi:AcrR family transcriptional regulator
MAAAARHPQMRSEPRQQRSRERLDRVLSAADAVLAEGGYDAFTTSAVAARAEVPPSSVYRWFADKDELATALLMRHLDRLDERMRAAVAAVQEVTISEVVRVVYEAYVGYYRDYPSHVILWFDGRVGRSTVTEVHRHTGRVAEEMRSFALGLGLIGDSVTVTEVRLMAEVIDRVHEYAFRENRDGDDAILERGLELAQAYYAQLGATRVASPTQLRGEPGEP